MDLYGFIYFKHGNWCYNNFLKRFLIAQADFVSEEMGYGSKC